MANIYKLAKREKELTSDALVLGNIDKTIIKIVAAMNNIGFPTKNCSIEDILHNDLSDINKFYRKTLEEYENAGPIQRSYKFLYKLLRKYGGKTLFDALEKIYGKEAETYNTNLQVELMKEIKALKELEIEAIIEEGTADLMG